MRGTKDNGRSNYFIITEKTTVTTFAINIREEQQLHYSSTIDALDLVLLLDPPLFFFVSRMDKLE